MPTFNHKILQPARIYITGARIHVSSQGGERNRRRDFYYKRSWGVCMICFLEIIQTQQLAGLVYLHSRPHIATRSRVMFDLPIPLIGGMITICSLDPIYRFYIRRQNNLQLIFFFCLPNAHIHTSSRAQSEWIGNERPTLKRMTTDVIFRVNNGSLLAFLHRQTNQFSMYGTSEEYVRLLADSHSSPVTSNKK